MRFDKGYIGPTFVTDAERMEAVPDDPYILIVNSKIGQHPRPAARAREGHGEVRPSAAGHRRGRRGRSPVHPGSVNKIRGTFKSVAVKAPASATAARPCCRHRDPHRWPGHLRGGRPLSSRTPTLDLFGQGPQGRRHQATRPRSSRVPATRTQIGSRRPDPRRDREVDSDYDREKLQERLAKLAGGVAVIKAARHRGRARSASTASRTPSATRRRPSRGHRRRWWRGPYPGRQEGIRGRLDLEGDEATALRSSRSLGSRPAEADRGQRRPEGGASWRRRSHLSPSPATVSTPPPVST